MSGDQCILPVVLPILVDNDDDDMLQVDPQCTCNDDDDDDVFQANRWRCQVTSMKRVVMMMMMTYFRRTDGGVRSPV